MVPEQPMDLIGVLALAAAAVLNVVLLRMLRPRGVASARGHWPTCAQ